MIESILIAATDAVFAYLLESTSLAQAVRQKLGRDPQRAAFRRAFGVTYAKFTKKYPGLPASLFDDQFLRRSAAPILAQCLQPENPPHGEALAAAWAEQLPLASRSSYISEIAIAASEFLSTLERELRQCPEFFDLFMGRDLHEMASNMGAQTELLRQLPGQIAGEFSDLLKPPAASAQLFGPPSDELLLPSPTLFVGRSDDLTWLIEQVTRQDGSVTAVRGMGGIGKTSLVAVALRRMKSDGLFPDGIAVVQCQGQIDAVRILQDVLVRFDSRRRQPEVHNLGRLLDVARQLFSGKQSLVVLDNIEPELQIEQVLAVLGAVGVNTLITARHSLPLGSVARESVRELCPLAEGEALDLFVRSIGKQPSYVLDAEEVAAAQSIVRQLERHTLAIRVAAAYVVESGRDLGTVAGELANPARVLHLPEGGLPGGVARVLSHSIEALSQHARRLFVACAVFETVEFSRAAAIAVGSGLDMTEVQAADALDELASRALVTALTDFAMPQSSDRERIRVHPLLRALATEELASWEREELIAAQRAMAVYYALYVRKCIVDSLERDEANVVGALNWAIGSKTVDVVTAICVRLQYLWQARSNFYAALVYLPLSILSAIQVAETTCSERDRLLAASQMLGYAQLLISVGEYDVAEAQLREALGYFQSTGNRQGEGAVLTNLGEVSLAHGDVDGAEASVDQAKTLLESVGDREGVATTLLMKGRILLERDQLEEAKSCARKARDILRQLGEKRGEAIAIHMLGNIAKKQGYMAFAREQMEHSLQLLRDSGTRLDVASCLGDLGQCILALSRPSTLSSRQPTSKILDDLNVADGYFTEALNVFKMPFNRLQAAHALYWLGCINLRRANLGYEPKQSLEAAHDHYARALDLYRLNGAKGNIVGVLALMGQVATLQNRFREAKTYCEEALALARSERDDRSTALILQDLGLLLLNGFGKRQQAMAMLADAVRLFQRVGLYAEAAETQQWLRAGSIGRLAIGWKKESDPHDQ